MVFWFCFWLGLFCLNLEDTWLFACTYSPICGNSESKTKRFDDRQSLERARHELKKKKVSHSCTRRPQWYFPALLNATLWGLRSGHTSFCVQGIFGSGKTYSASLLLILFTSVLGLRTVLTADPNLPLATAAKNLSDLLRDAHKNIRSQYARCLAQNIPKTTNIDVLSVDRSQLFQPDSLLRCF